MSVVIPRLARSVRFGLRVTPYQEAVLRPARVDDGLKELFSRPVPWSR
jgi:hypothetical protein